MKKFLLVLGGLIFAIFSWATPNNQMLDTALATTTPIYLSETGQATVSLNPNHYNASADSIFFSQVNFACADINQNNTLYIQIFDTTGVTAVMYYADSTVAQVLDTMAPQVAIVPSITLYLGSWGSDTLTFADIDLGTTDNCGLNITGFKVLTKTIYDCTDLGTLNYTMSFPDYNGNLATSLLPITVVDTVAPDFTLQTDTFYLNGAGSQVSVSYQNLVKNLNENCAVAQGLVDGAAQKTFTCSDTGFHQMVVAVTDVSSNTKTRSAAYYVLDTASPSYQKVPYSANIIAGSATVSRGDILQNVVGGCFAPKIEMLSDTVFNCTHVGTNPNYVVFSIANGPKVITDSVPVTVVDNTPIVYFKNPKTLQLVGDSVAVSRSEIVTLPPVGCVNQAFHFLSDTVFYCANANTNPNYVVFTINKGGSSILDSVPVTVDDISPPTLQLASDTLVLMAGAAQLHFANVDNGSFDNCGIDSTTLNGAQSLHYTCADTGLHRVEVIVYDPSGLFASDSIDIYVADTFGPSYTKTPHTAYLIGDSVRVKRSKILTNIAGSCFPTTITFISDTSFSCADVYTNPNYIKFVATSGTVSRTDSVAVTVQDITPPQLLLKSDTLFLTGMGSSVSLNFAQIDAGSTDNCALDTATINGTNSIQFSCADTGWQNIVVVLFDQRGNATTDSIFVFVADTVSPTFSASPATAYVTNGTAAVSRGSLFTQINGGCFAPTLTFLTDTTFTCNDIASNPNYVKFSLANGLAVLTDSIAVTVMDTTPPIALLKTDTLILVNGFASLQFAQIDNGSADNCAIDSALMNGQTTLNFTCADTGTQQIIVTLWDVNGNQNNVTTTVFVADTLQPTYIKTPLTVSLLGSAESISRNDFLSVSSIGCFPPAIHILSDTIFDCTSVLTSPHFVKFSFTSAAGVKLDSVAVTVIDTVKPTLLLKSDTLILANNAATLSFANIDFGSADNCSIDSATVNQQAQITYSCADSGAHKIGVVLYDIHGNWAADSVLIYVRDTISPSYTKTPYQAPLVGNSATVSRQNILSNVVAGCFVPTVQLFSDTTFTCADISANPHYIQFSVSTGSQTFFDSVAVTVVDTTLPDLLLQPDTLFLLNGTATLQFSDVDFGSTDNCGLDSALLNGTNTLQFACATAGKHRIGVSLFDVHGNVKTDSVDVYVQDTVTPTFTKSNKTVYYSSSDIALSRNAYLSNINGGCSAPFVTIKSDTVFNCADISSNPNYIVFEITNGINPVLDSVAVTVVDTIKPSFSLKPPQALSLAANGERVLTATDLLVNLPTDNCNIDSVSIIPRKLTCNNTQNYATVIITAYDLSGNFTTKSTLAIAVDVTSPTLVTKTDTVFLDTISGVATANHLNLIDTLGDGCGLDTVFMNKNIFGCADIGLNLVSITAVDIHGNQTLSNAQLYVLDTSAPVFTAQNATAYLDANGNATLAASTILIGPIKENCSVVDTALSQTQFTCTDVGSNPFKIWVTDNSGNADTLNLLAQVVDTILPTVAIQNLVVPIDTATGNATVSLWDVVLSATDNCAIDSANSTLIPNIFDCTNIGTNQVAVYVRDKNGNVRVLQTNITVTGSIISGSKIVGDTAVCGNAYNVKYSLSSIRNSSQYVWTVNGGTIVSTSFKGREIYVHWGKTTGDFVLTVKEQNVLNCGEIISDTTIKISGAAPDTARIVYWNNATKNTLVSTEADANRYQWGYDENTSGPWQSTYLNGETSNSYYNPDIAVNIDLFGYKYWCETSFDGICWTRSYFQNNYPINIEEFEGNDIQLWPNPFEKQLRIDSKRPIENIKISSAIGEIVLNRKVDGVNQLTLEELSGLAPGAYILTLTYSNGQLSQHKLVHTK